mmetsp:Transcript_97856/g.169472  ORF Transcript_97856/g.169472 Transcript_97856/m.169472 type:complete len:500 (-) Transcript_97856:25-1524(-)
MGGRWEPRDPYFVPGRSRSQGAYARAGDGQSEGWWKSNDLSANTCITSAGQGSRYRSTSWQQPTESRQETCDNSGDGFSVLESYPQPTAKQYRYQWRWASWWDSWEDHQQEWVNADSSKRWHWNQTSPSWRRGSSLHSDEQCTNSAQARYWQTWRSWQHGNEGSEIPRWTEHSASAAQGKSIVPCTVEDFESKYQLGEELAAGTRGVIYLATESSTGRSVVVKKPDNKADTRDFDFVVGKCHPNIVKVFQCFCLPSDTFIVMQYCAGGDLFQALQRFSMPPAESWSMGVFAQTLQGVRYLHEMFRESHNDLKPENLLLHHAPSNSEDVPCIMLADFGCTAAAGTCTQATGGGDPRYRAPETFWHAPFGFSTDAWSLGVVLYEIISGGILIYTGKPNISGFRNFRRHDGGNLCREFMKMLRSGKRVHVGDCCGDAAREVLLGLLKVEVAQRMTVENACSHRWFMNQDATASAAKDEMMPASAPAPCPPGSPSKKSARGGC